MKHTMMLMTAIVSLAAAVPVNACSYNQQPEPVGQTTGEYFASQMVAAATYVDLALVEDDGIRGMDETPTGIITLRAIARLKGTSADRFSLFGTGLTLSPNAERVAAAPLLHFTSDTGYAYPFAYNEERERNLFPANGSDLRSTLRLTSCSPPELAAQTGRFYVVMRDGDGRLLDSFSMSDGKAVRPNMAAFGFVSVNLEDDDFWLRAVNLAVLRSANTKSDDLLFLASGADAARAERTIRASAQKIKAAYFDRGEFIEEVRPSSDEQGIPWLARAGPYAVSRFDGAFGLSHHAAAEFLRRKLGPMARDSNAYEVAQAFTKSVRQVQLAVSLPKLVALEVSGDPQAFVGQDFVDRIGALDRQSGELPRLTGDDETAVFNKLQQIDRDIWLMNGGASNPQGTLP